MTCHFISNSYKFIIMENSLITAFLVGLRQISQIRDKKGGKVQILIYSNTYKLKN